MSNTDHKKSILSLNGRANDEWAIMPTLSLVPEYKNRFLIHVMDTDYDHEHRELSKFNPPPFAWDMKKFQHGTSTAALLFGRTCGLLPSNINVNWYSIDPTTEQLIMRQCQEVLHNIHDSPIRFAKHLVLINWQLRDNGHNASIIEACETLIKTMIKQGAEVYVATGNKGIQEKLFPCNVPGVTVVGAHDKNGIINLFNNTPADIDIFAPGRSISVPKAGTKDQYIEQDGSSLSCALVVAARCYFASKEDMFDHAIKDTLAWRNRSDFYRPSLKLFLGKHNYGLPDIEYGNVTLQTVKDKARIIHDWEYARDPDFDEKSYTDLCVEHINNTQRGDVMIPMSGGLDSEFVMHCALRANITPIPIIMRYMDYNGLPLNEYDYSRAVEYCSKHNLTPRFYDASVAELFDRGAYWRYGATYGSRSPQLAAHLWLLSQIKMPSIMPGDPVNYHRTAGISVQPHEYYCYDRYFHDTKRVRSIPRLHTANGLIVRKGLELTIQVENEKDKKHAFYTLAGMDCMPRPKYTGFEQVREFYDKYHKTKNYFNKKFRVPLQRLHDREQEFFYKGRVDPRIS